jgi:hypothetical protein
MKKKYATNSLGIVGNSEHECLTDVELLSMVDNSEDPTGSNSRSHILLKLHS